MKFIGRQTELETLEREYQRDSSFVVLYGRRRVGKTTLMKEFIRNKTAFYFLATQETESQSMKRFAGVLARATGNRLLQNASFSDWADLFQAAADYKPEEKKVLVIDEFPYLVKTNPAFPSLLQSIWDEQLKGSGIMLILCGSLIGMMKKYALSHDSPLYGRRTAQIRLMPLSFPEVRAAQQLPFAECVTQYAVTGGVPKYMEFFREDQDFTEQLREVVLSRNGFLYEEPQFLFSEEIQSPVNYFSILRTVADGNRKPSKIGSVLGMDSSALSPYLATLMELGFLTKQVPITEKNPERSRKGLYEISDNFIRFCSGMSIRTRESWSWTINRSSWRPWQRISRRSLSPLPMNRSAAVSLRNCAEPGSLILRPRRSVRIGSTTPTVIQRSTWPPWISSTDSCSWANANTTPSPSESPSTGSWWKRRRELRSFTACSPAMTSVTRSSPRAALHRSSWTWQREAVS